MFIFCRFFRGHPLEIAQTDEAATAASGDIVAGQYMFELQVWDEENLSSTMKLFVDVEDDGKKDDGKKQSLFFLFFAFW